MAGPFVLGIMDVTHGNARLSIDDIFVAWKPIEDFIERAQLAKPAGFIFAAALGHRNVDADLHAGRERNEAPENRSGDEAAIDGDARANRLGDGIVGKAFAKQHYLRPVEIGWFRSGLDDRGDVVDRVNLAIGQLHGEANIGLFLLIPADRNFVDLAILARPIANAVR